MSPVVRIPEKTYSRLKSLAEPFTDTPATVIERLLDFHEKYTNNKISRDNSRTNDGLRTSTIISTSRKSEERITRQQGKNDEVLTFAKQLGAQDLKSQYDPRLNRVLRRRNYFLLAKDMYLIVKLSRSEKPFFGLGKQFVDLFNELTEESGTYYFVGLDSHNTGWLISKNSLLQDIDNGSISWSEGASTEYKINYYNLRSQQRFLSISDCRDKIDHVA